MHYLAEWREWKDWSLRKLALRLEQSPGEELLSASSLGRVEKGEQPLTPEILAALADAFDCGPEDIITVNPLIEPEVIDLMAVIRKLRAKHNPERIAEATEYLEHIAKRA